MERRGAEQARALKSNIIGTELGMSMNQLAAANIARQQASAQIAGGAGNLLAGGVGMYQDYKSGSGTDMGKPLADLTRGITEPVTPVYDPNVGDPLLEQGDYTPSYTYP